VLRVACNCVNTSLISDKQRVSSSGNKLACICTQTYNITDDSNDNNDNMIGVINILVISSTPQVRIIH